MIDPERLALHQLDDVALRRLMTKTLAYAAWKLGGRAGSGAEMGAEDLAMRAVTDTLEGRRNWNATHTPLEYHLRGCINSYISHYFDSLQGRRSVDVEKSSQRSVSHENDHTNGASMEGGAEAWLRDDVRPEDHLEARQTMDAISASIRDDGDPKLIAMWELVWKEHLNLQVDRVEISERLGIDVTVGSAGYQTFNKLRNRLKQISEMELSHGFPLSARKILVSGSGDD